MQTRAPASHDKDPKALKHKINTRPPNQINHQNFYLKIGPTLACQPYLRHCCCCASGLGGGGQIIMSSSPTHAISASL